MQAAAHLRFQPSTNSVISLNSFLMYDSVRNRSNLHEHGSLLLREMALVKLFWKLCLAWFTKIAILFVGGGKPTTTTFWWFRKIFFQIPSARCLLSWT